MMVDVAEPQVSTGLDPSSEVVEFTPATEGTNLGELKLLALSDEFETGVLAAVLQNNESAVRTLAQSVLVFWEVADNPDQVSVKQVQNDKGKSEWRVEVVNGEGEITNSYHLEGLRKHHLAKRGEMVRERTRQVNQVDLLCQMTRGVSAKDAGYSFSPVKENSGDLLVHDGERWHTFKEMEERLQAQRRSGILGVRQSINNLATAMGDRRRAVETYINSETRFGRAIGWAFGKREEARTAREQRIKQREIQLENNESAWLGVRQYLDKGWSHLSRAVSYPTAVARAAASMVAYDYNPLRPLLGKTVGKLYRHEFTSERLQKALGLDGSGKLSIEEVTGLLQEKLMKDYITGEGKRLDLASENNLRGAAVAAVELAIKMNILPQYLAGLPALAAANVTPGEIWSLFRSAKMVTSSPGSIRKFIEVFRQAKSTKEKAALTATAAAAAPFFLVAEKLFPNLTVGPLKDMNLLLMGDIAAMRLLSLFERHMKITGGEGTKNFRFLQAVETGITGAFAYDAARSVSERVITYAETGAIVPLAHLKTEEDLLQLVKEHPQYLANEGGGLPGMLGRLEHELIEGVRPGEQEHLPAPTTLQLVDDAGALAVYTVSTKDGQIEMVKSTETTIGLWDGDAFINMPLPIAESRVQLTDQGETNAGVQGALVGETDLNHEVEVIHEQPEALAVHDYVIWNGEGDRFTFRMDLRPDETVADKVDRLFNRTFDDPWTRDELALSGAAVQELEPGDELLEAVAGDDNIYEQQIYRDLIFKLENDARLNDLEYDRELVMARFANVLDQGFVSQTTIEGEIVYSDLYQYLFQGSFVDTHDVDPAREVYQPYFVEGILRPEDQVEIAFEVDTTVSQALLQSGYLLTASGVYDANGNLVDDAQIYRIVEGDEVVQTIEDLGIVRPGEEFVLRIGHTAAEVGEYELPKLEPITNEDLGDDEGRVDETTDDVVETVPAPDGLYRDAAGVIRVGEVLPGDGVSALIMREMAELGNPWTMVLDAFLAGEIEIYVTDAEGNVLRNFETVDDMGLVFVGERVVIVDEKNVLGVPEYVPVVEEQTPELIDIGVTSEALLTLEGAIKERVAADAGARLGIIVLDPADPGNTSLVFNPELVFSTEELMALPLSMLVLRAVERGEIGINDPVGSQTLSGYNPTVLMLLRQAMIDTSPSALFDLAKLVTGEEDQQQVVTRLNDVYRRELGLENEHFFGSTALGDEGSTTTPQEMMQLLTMFYSGEVISQENVDMLLAWMGVAQNTPVSGALEVYPGVNVLELTGEGASDNQDQAGLHSLSVVTSAEGNDLLVVAMSEARMSQNEGLLRGVMRDIYSDLRPTDIDVSSASFAYQVTYNQTMQLDLVSRILYPTSHVGSEPTLNPEISRVLPNLTGIDLMKWSHQVDLLPDGSSRLVLTNPDTQADTLLLLDAEQHVVYGLNTEILGNEQIKFESVEVSERAEYFTGPDFVDALPYTLIESTQMDGSEIGINPFNDAELVVAELALLGVQADFVILPAYDGVDSSVRVVAVHDRGERDGGVVDTSLDIVLIGGTNWDADLAKAAEVLENQLGRSLQASGVFIEASKIGIDTSHLGEGVLPQPEQLQELTWVGAGEVGASGERSFNVRGQVLDTAIDQVGIEKATYWLVEQMPQPTQEYLRREFERMQEYTDRYEQLTGWDLSTVDYKQFQLEFWQMAVNQHTSGTGMERLTLTRDEWLNCLGLNPVQTVYEGVSYFDVQFLPQNMLIDERALATHYGIEPENLVVTKTNDPSVVLVGERVEQIAGGVDVSLSYPYGNGQVLYVYDDGSYATTPLTEYSYIWGPSRSMVSAIPLSKPIEAFMGVSELYSLGEIPVSEQYAGDEYLVERQIETDQAIKLVDPASGRLYGLRGDDLYPLIGDQPTYDEWGSYYGETSLEVEAIFTYRLLDRIGRLRGESHTYYERFGTTLVEMTEAGSGGNFIFSLGTDTGDLVLDQSGKWIYSNEAGEHFTYNRTTGLLEKSVVETVVLDEFLTGFYGLTDEQGVALQHGGFPLLTKDELVYVLDESGLVLVGTIYDTEGKLVVSDSRVDELLTSFGVEQTQAWSEARSYQNLVSVEEKYLHGVGLNLNGFLETSRGLYDPEQRALYTLAADNGEILVDSNSGKPALEMNGQFYVETARTLEERDRGALITREEYIQSQQMEQLTLTDPESMMQIWGNSFLEWLDTDRSIGGFTFDLLPGEHSGLRQYGAVDRRTELPVYTNGDEVYGFDGRDGWIRLGTVRDMIRTGLIGYTGDDGRFDTVVPELWSLIITSELLTRNEKIGMLIDPLWNTIIRSRADAHNRRFEYSDELELVLGSENYVSYDEIPIQFLQALIAVEDEHTFSMDEGEERPASWYAISRALPRYILHKLDIGEDSEIYGGSTLTHQFLRNTLKSFTERSAAHEDRKWWEWETAVKVLETISLEHVVESYVNVANYRALGAEAGAQALFGKHLNELDLAESAMLVVVSNAPASQSMDTHRQADAWGDTATGALRRMRENGFITEAEFEEARLEVFELVHPSAAQPDVEHLERIMSFLQIAGQGVEQIDSLAQEYQALTFDERMLTLPNGDRYYLDFYEYVTRNLNLDLFSRSLILDAARRGYYGKIEDSPIAAKWGHDPRGYGLVEPADQSEMVDLNYLSSPRATGVLMTEVEVDSEGRVNLDKLPYVFNAVAESNAEELPVVGRTEAGEAILRDGDTMWIAGEGGLERLPQRILGTTEVQRALDRIGMIDITGIEGGIAAGSELWVDPSGDYYVRTQGGESRYIGRVFSHIDGTRVLVAIPQIHPVSADMDDLDMQTVTTMLGHLYSRNTENWWGATVEGYTDGELLRVGETIVGVNTAQGYQSLPEALAQGLTEDSFTSQAIELERTSAGERALYELITNALDASIAEATASRELTTDTRPGAVLVWLGDRSGSEVVEINTGSGTLLDTQIAHERLVAVTGFYTHEGVDYVVVGQVWNGQMQYSAFTWEEFIYQAAPIPGSRYKALVLDGNPLPQSVTESRYALASTSSQLELAMLDQTYLPNWESEGGYERLMTVNPSMQMWMENRGAEWVRNSGSSGFMGIAMDGEGNIIFNTSLDGNGEVVAGNPTATQSLTPGSVFKIITVMWALENGMDPNELITAGHRFELPGGATVNNWTVNSENELVGSAPAKVTLADLLKYSNNPAAYRLVYEQAELMGITDPDALMDFAKSIGFGEAHGIPGFPNLGGIIPDDEYAIAHPAYGAPLDIEYHGLHAMGEHDVQVTALEMLRTVGAIANGGVIFEPNLVRGDQAITAGQLPLTPEQLAVVQEGMLSVTSESGGTAYNVFGDVGNRYTVYGKTGTAELGSGLVPHAWFVGWAVDRVTGEKNIFTFVFENGGEGSQVAAPAVRQMLDEYFSHLDQYQARTDPPPNLEHVSAEVSSDIDGVSDGTALDTIQGREFFMEVGRKVETLVRDPGSYMGLVDRAVSRIVDRNGGSWHEYAPEENIEAGNRIYNWLTDAVADEAEVRVEKLYLAARSIPFREAGENELFDVVVRVGNPDAERKVVITAHYDTRPDDLAGGEEIAQGASDNGWTVAMMMQLAAEMPEQELPNDVEYIFAFTTAEEVWYDGMDGSKRVGGARALVNSLLAQGSNPGSIVAINTDGLVNLAQPEDWTMRLFQPDPDLVNPNDRRAAAILAKWLQAAGFSVAQLYTEDREDGQGNERWGDQIAFLEAGFGETVRVMAGTEMPIESTDDLVPHTLAPEVTHRTGLLIEVLRRAILDQQLFETGPVTAAETVIQ